ncbi:hypothetical protein ACFL0F_01145 [Patescibacteria group bacterium]
MFRQPKGKVTKSYIKVYQARNATIARLILWTIIIFVLIGFKNDIIKFFINAYNISLEPSIGLAYVLTLVLLFIWVALGALVYFLWRGSYYEVFPDRVVAHHGIKGDEVRAVNMSDFLGINLGGSQLGSLLGYGTITFEYRMASAEGKKFEALHNIPNPEFYLEKIEEVIRVDKRPKDNEED